MASTYCVNLIQLVILGNIPPLAVGFAGPVFSGINVIAPAIDEHPEEGMGSARVRVDSAPPSHIIGNLVRFDHGEFRFELGKHQLAGVSRKVYSPAPDAKPDRCCRWAASSSPIPRLSWGPQNT